MSQRKATSDVAAACRERALGRREFLRRLTALGAGAAATGLTLNGLAGCSGGGSRGWPISKDVFTTAQQQVLPVGLGPETPPINPADVSLYEQYGYSAWCLGPGLPHVKRTELAPDHDGGPNVARLLSFFSISDAHISDKESPAQPIYIGWSALYGRSSAYLSAAYSATLLSTTQVLDAVVQTINALHRQTPFDFGISLGDAINNSQYNELRWYIDVLDGKVITPSSGAHAGADSVDYQRAFKAVGLDKGIPWYQVIGNHDQFWMGSAFENSKTMQAHVGSTILNMKSDPDPSSGAVNLTGAYMGVVDGSTPLGNVIGAGPQEDFAAPPSVVPDAHRRTLATTDSTSRNWMAEFFNTSSAPIGHGFTQANLDGDLACYCFEPKSSVPLKVIVLDDTCKGEGQRSYALAGLDQPRIDWLKSALQKGQDEGKLMIIAAHIPVKPQLSFTDTRPFPFFRTPPFTDDALLAILHGYPNLILWISGHRHVNTVTPQPDPGGDPTRSFWEVETASLRDLPQQFRTFDIRRNGDGTISIVITNVDTAVVAGSPAAKSRGYAIGDARIFGATPTIIADTTSRAYNAELVKQLSSDMQAKLADCGSAIE